MSAAPSWPLVSSLPKERTFRKTVATVSRVEFRSISRPKAQFQAASPEFVLQTFKTQNDARGAETHPPVQTMSSRTAKARNCPSPNGLMGRNAGLLTTNRAFVLATPYGLTIPKNREASPRFPTLFCVRRATSEPVARHLHSRSRFRLSPAGTISPLRYGRAWLGHTALKKDPRVSLRSLRGWN
jgi:hypothetical protein